MQSKRSYSGLVITKIVESLEYCLYAVNKSYCYRIKTWGFFHRASSSWNNFEMPTWYNKVISLMYS